MSGGESEIPTFRFVCENFASEGRRVGQFSHIRKSLSLSPSLGNIKFYAPDRLSLGIAAILILKARVGEFVRERNCMGNCVCSRIVHSSPSSKEYSINRRIESTYSYDIGSNAEMHRPVLRFVDQSDISLLTFSDFNAIKLNPVRVQTIFQKMTRYSGQSVK